MPRMNSPPEYVILGLEPNPCVVKTVVAIREKKFQHRCGPTVGRRLLRRRLEVRLLPPVLECDCYERGSFAVLECDCYERGIFRRSQKRKGKPIGDGTRLEIGRAMSLQGSTPSPSAHESRESANWQAA